MQLTLSTVSIYWLLLAILHLIEIIEICKWIFKEKLKIEDNEERTEAIGETLFYFLSFRLFYSLFILAVNCKLNLSRNMDLIQLMENITIVIYALKWLVYLLRQSLIYYFKSY